MTELDAKLRHRLQEREQLVHHLLLKLQRSPSQQPAPSSASECTSATATSPAAPGTPEQQKPPQQLIGSSKLVEAYAQLAVVSKKFAALKTPAIDSRKSLRVLFSGKYYFVFLLGILVTLSTLTSIRKRECRTIHIVRIFSTVFRVTLY